MLTKTAQFDHHSLWSDIVQIEEALHESTPANIVFIYMIFNNGKYI